MTDSDAPPAGSDDPHTDEASAVGAYYTGEDVSAFVARRGLWEALRARLGGLYLDFHADRVRTWSDDLLAEGPPRDRVRELFESFYTARFATPAGTPSEDWDAVESVLAATVAVTADWETDRVCGSREMAIVEDTLR